MTEVQRKPAVMDDGRNRPSHDAGCIIAGAAFFATFFPRGKKVDDKQTFCAEKFFGR